MEVKSKKLHTPSTPPLTVSSAMVVMMIVMLWLTFTPVTFACGGPALKDRSGCKDCIVDQMKYGCPSCVPLFRCMARCLWGGTARSKCIQICDCDGGKPKLSDCKKCMGRCKCSCVA